MFTKVALDQLHSSPSPHHKYHHCHHQHQCQHHHHHHHKLDKRENETRRQLKVLLQMERLQRELCWAHIISRRPQDIKGWQSTSFSLHQVGKIQRQKQKDKRQHQLQPPPLTKDTKVTPVVQFPSHLELVKDYKQDETLNI